MKVAGIRGSIYEVADSWNIPMATARLSLGGGAGE